MQRTVWIPDRFNEWTQAKVLSESNNGLDVSVEDPNNHNNIKSFHKNDICEVDQTHLLDLDDLCQMNNLHEAPLIHMLKQRWLVNKIYTYAGDVLISINPYQLITGLYENYDDYLQLSIDNIDEPKKNKNPHLYYIANYALNELINPTKLNEKFMINQSILISGESGAGKTEASKRLINFFIYCNKSSEAIKLNNLILHSSTIFESFGNAKTVRNDNSSRFGKYMKLMYNDDNVLISAHTETFLLEKSRLVNVNNNERNYHIFYEMLTGLSIYNETLYKNLLLSNDFKILLPANISNHSLNNQSDNDNQNFSNLLFSLHTLYISSHEINDIFSFLSLLLHLGNISFKEIINKNDYELHLEIHISSCSIDFIIHLLGLNNSQELNRGFTTQRIKIARRSSINVKQLSVSESLNNVLALIKYLYSKLFNYIVNRINKCHSTELLTTKFIGILDIFGFEILTTNSFEQLCINYTNECLQQYFNEYILQTEQQLYINECINWEMISYYNNQDVIDCISKKPNGLLNLLDEYIVMNRKPDDIALANTYNSMNEKSTIYGKGRFGNDTFTIKHYAGSVSYTIHGFIQKNNNTLHHDLLSLVAISTNKFINTLLSNDLIIETEKKETTVPSKQLTTVSIQFRVQLDNLMQTLRNTKPHYIKCIKPNDIKSSTVYTSSLVNLQCKYSGIYEVVRIRREGFPIRLKYGEFYQRYKIFNKIDKFNINQYSDLNDKIDNISDSDKSIKLFKSYTIAIISTIFSIEQYQIGQTMIFLKIDCLSIINKYVKDLFVKYATKLQAFKRCVKQKLSYKYTRRCIIKIQTFLRQKSTKFLYKSIIKSITIIQSRYRKYLNYKRYKYKSLILIQANIRLYINKRRYNAIRKFIIKIQSFIRKTINRLKYVLLLKSTRKIQIYYRRYYNHNKLMHNSAVKLQSFIRCLNKKIKYKNARKCIVRLQSFYRCYQRRLNYKLLKKHIITVETFIRKSINRLKYLKRLHFIRIIQSNYRRYIKYKQLKSRSIIKIQTCFRCMNIRYKYKRMRKSCVVIQTLIRCKINKYRYQRKLKSAIKIQTCFRKSYNKLNYIIALKSIAIIQSKYRRYITNKKFLIRNIIIMQKFIRKVLYRYNFLMKLKSIRIIQKYYKDYINNKKLQLLSVLIIQKFIRRIINRLKYLTVQRSVLIIQFHYRQYIQLKKLKFYNIVKIQSFIRCYNNKYKYKYQLQRITKLQTFTRLMLNRLKYLSKRNAIIMIQSKYRTYIKRKKVINKCIVIVQSFIRKSLRRLKYLKLLKAINLIKSKYRKYVSIKNYYMQCVIKLQTFIRTVLNRLRYINTIKSTILIQLMYRKYCIFKRYKSHCVIILQSEFRCFNQKIKFKRTINKIIKLQTFIRKSIKRLKYISMLMSIRRLQAAVTIQSFIRKFIYRNKYLKYLKSISIIQFTYRKFIIGKKIRINFIVKIQSFIRKKICRYKYLALLKAILENHSIIRIQSISRRFINRFKYLNILNAIIVIQKIFRRHVSHNSFMIRYKLEKEKKKLNKSIISLQTCIRINLSKKKLFNLKKLRNELYNCVIIQSYIRMHFTQQKYSKIRNSIRIINKYIRMYSIMIYRKKLIAAVGKLKKYITRVIRNNRVYNYITRIHNYTMFDNLNTNINDFITKINKHYNINNELNIYQLRNKWFHYQTLFHAICYNKSINVISQISIQPTDLLQYDLRMYTPITIIFIHNNIDMINYIFDLFSSYNYKPLNTIRTIIDDDDNNSNDITIQQPNHIIKEGWLKKRNILGIWQKRYAILTDTNLLYFNNPNNRTKPNFSIPLDGIIVNRLLNKENIIEIVLNNNVKQKNSFFGLKKNIFQFQTVDEIELQNWLYPIRAVVGIQSFRSQSIRYILLDLYDKLINETNLLYHLICNYNSEIDDKKLFLMKCSWLIDKGCAIDYKDKNNKSLSDHLKEKGLKELENYIYKVKSYLNTRQFIRLSGYSYLSIRFENHLLKKSIVLPALYLSVYNSKKKLIEDIQHIDTPIINLNESIYWGTTWHLHTPFENMEDLIYLQIELKDLKSNEMISCIRFDVNKETINSKLLILDNCLHCCVIISRKSKSYNIQDIRNSNISTTLIG